MVKIISITNAVYEKLKKRKLKNKKSFSEEIDELMETANKGGDVKLLRNYLGRWNSTYAKELAAKIAADRKKIHPRSF